MTASPLGFLYAISAVLVAVVHERLWKGKRGFSLAGFTAWLGFSLFAVLAMGEFVAPNAPLWGVVLLGLFGGSLSYAYLWGMHRHSHK